MSEAMQLTQREFEQIGSYVREHLGTWIREISPPPTTVQLDPVFLERIIRVEEELKSQRELMKYGFEQVDKRFEQVDTRFEETRSDMNTRFQEMRADMDTRFQEMRADMDTRFEDMRADMDTRFEDMRADMATRFESVDKQLAVARSHTNHWMTFLTIVLLVLGSAMTLATVLSG